MELTVSSVSKKSQPITNAAAAVFVISQDDIKRSGATTIADALRMAPGIQVARIDGNKWAVSSRGFNGRFANKLLVLMDGRSLYTPYFSGVYWEVQDTVMEDIDRIEIIRGPGAALWGVNAVNGVINIITKSAENTLGSLIAVGGGTYEKAFATARFGTEISDNTNLKLYAKHQQRDNFVLNSGADNSNDQWHKTQGGFRLDTRLTPQDNVTVQGDYYTGRLDETYILFDRPTTPNPPYNFERHVNTSTAVSGGNLISRWQRENSETDSLSLQLYVDHSTYDMLVSPQVFNTIDVDFQQRFSAAGINDIVWGVEYRYYDYSLDNTSTLSFTTTQVTNNIFSVFMHDEVTLIPGTLSLILGTRLENNDYAGFTYQPNARLLWTLSPHNSAWGSFSRAVRSATKGEQDISYNYRSIAPGSSQNPHPTLPLRLEILGNKDFKSEELLAYELGYRTELTPRLSLDVAVYYNEYKNLRVINPGQPYQETSAGIVTNNTQPYMLSNDMYGTALGAELAIDWTPLDWWRIQAAYSYQDITMSDKGYVDTINKGNAEGDTPQHQLSLRSGLDIGKSVSLDLWLRAVDQLPSIDSVTIPGYVTLDARLGWKPAKNLEISVVGQNLLQSSHPEFVPEYINTLQSEVVRSVYGKATWKF
jgi:iron complex outermembrane receptor protein